MSSPMSKSTISSTAKVQPKRITTNPHLAYALNLLGTNKDGGMLGSDVKGSGSSSIVSANTPVLLGNQPKSISLALGQHVIVEETTSKYESSKYASNIDGA